MTIRLSAKEKVSLIRRYLLGERISSLCLEAKISRTIFYRWIYVYKDNPEYKVRGLLKIKLKKGNNHYKHIPNSIALKVLLRKKHNPDLSTRSIARTFGVSHTYVWRVLLRDGQDISRKSFSRPYSLRASDKIIMIRRFETGEKVSVICRDFGISRTLFYRYLKKYQLASPDERTVHLFERRNVHYRYMPEVRKSALEIIKLSPRLSIRQIRAELIKRGGNTAVSRQTIQRVLSELHLDSKIKRINFSNITEPIVN